MYLNDYFPSYESYIRGYYNHNLIIEPLIVSELRDFKLIFNLNLIESFIIKSNDYNYWCWDPEHLKIIRVFDPDNSPKYDIKLSLKTTDLKGYKGNYVEVLLKDALKAIPKSKEKELWEKVNQCYMLLKNVGAHSK